MNIKDRNFIELTKAMIRGYELILLGRSRVLDKSLIEQLSDDEKEYIAIQMIKYVSEHFWGWSPETLRDHLTLKKISEWHLKPMVKFIRFPIGMHPSRDMDMCYVAHLIYPHIIDFDQKELAVRVYKTVLAGDIKKFPKNYFESIYGLDRAAACLSYAIEQFHPFSSIDEMYEFFGDDKRAKAFLKDVELYPEAKNTFDVPVELLHYALEPEYRNNFLFLYYRLSEALEIKYNASKETRGRRRTAIKN